MRFDVKNIKKKERKDFLWFAKRLNPNYKKVIKYLAKEGIDFTTSPSINYKTKSKSIYVTLAKFNDYNLQVRISDHKVKDKNTTLEDFCLYLNYEDKFNMRKFKKDFEDMAKRVIQKRNELVEKEKSIGVNGNLMKKYNHRVKKLKKVKGKKKYTELIRENTFGLANTFERIKIIDEIIK